jgi:hypothetical protein
MPRIRREVYLSSARESGNSQPGETGSSAHYLDIEARLPECIDSRGKQSINLGRFEAKQIKIRSAPPDLATHDQGCTASKREALRFRKPGDDSGDFLLQPAQH